MTMSKRFTFDTNLLIYAIDRDAGTKRERAIDLMSRAREADCVLLLQTLAEFYHATTRKGLIAPREAAALIDQWLIVFPAVGYGADTLQAALKRASRPSGKGGSGLWDALLIQSARAAGCAIFLTEDMQDGATIDGIAVRNPLLGSQLDPKLVVELGL